MFHFDFSWEFLFCLVSVRCPSGLYVEAHMFFAQYLPVAKLPGLIHFILSILEATEPTGWMATFSFQAVLGKKTGQCWFLVRLFPCLNTKSSGQLIKPYVLPALLGGACVLWDCVDAQCCCGQAQKDSSSVCSTVTFPPKVQRVICSRVTFPPKIQRI